MERTLAQVSLTCCLWSTQSTDQKDLTTNLYQGKACQLVCGPIKLFRYKPQGISLRPTSQDFFILFWQDKDIAPPHPSRISKSVNVYPPLPAPLEKSI